MMKKMVTLSFKACLTIIMVSSPLYGQGQSDSPSDDDTTQTTFASLDQLTSENLTKVKKALLQVQATLPSMLPAPRGPDPSKVRKKIKDETDNNLSIIEKLSKDQSKDVTKEEKKSIGALIKSYNAKGELSFDLDDQSSFVVKFDPATTQNVTPTILSHDVQLKNIVAPEKTSSPAPTPSYQKAFGQTTRKAGQ